MSSLHSRRMLVIAAATVCLTTLVTACGPDAEPDADPSATENAQGQIGEVTPTPTGATTPPTATTTAGGGGGGGNASSYPDNAKDYGLALLQAIKNNDQTRIVDLADVNAYQWAIVQHSYQDRNGEWTYSHCDSGVTQNCFYYNVPGDFAQVLVESDRLGRDHAVNAVTIEGNTFPTDAGNYVLGFIGHWMAGRRVGMNAYATNGVVSFVQGASTPQAGIIDAPEACGSGRQCVVAGEYVVAGSPGGTLIRFVVQTNRLGAADAIVEASFVS